ncbi:hypothetical protein D9757_008193 [Collybiopsis confluens]|uniref:Major facilitator superfamily (MFS) profile domain-containing protein n=1 Tax=Collybiopsis confluens TaxID=2823264 RepID=A0A8H5M472_9AGAR|nr:hypothetical protein D9757_008193 [Collybiopsis confluens]
MTMTKKKLENIQLKDVKSWTMVEIRPLSPVEEDLREQDYDMPAVDAPEELLPQYVSGASLVLIVLGLCLTIFVIHLDANIIATAIPHITSTFNSLDDIGWYGSAYLLTSTALQPCFGRLYTHFNLKIIYLVALLIFEAGSIICATATNSSMFIAGRAVAGTGVAALLSGSMSLLAFSIPLEKRPMYIGIVSSMYGISAVVGPVLGGVLTDRLSWRWCFWINPPCGALTFFAITYFFQSPHRNSTSSDPPLWKKLNEIDVLGATLFIGSTICLLLALQWGGTQYAWGNVKIWGLFLGCFMIFGVFIIWQRFRRETALLPIKLLTQRSVLASTAVSLFYSMVLAIYIYYLPIYFQAVQHTTAANSAIQILPFILSLTVTIGVVGFFITMTGEYLHFVWLGAVMIIVGSGMLSTLKVDSPLSHRFGYQIILGIGAGATAQVPFLVVQIAVRPSDAPLGLSLIMLANNAGGAVAISIAQSVFINALMKNIRRYAPDVDPHTVIKGGITELSNAGIEPAILAKITQAFAQAIRATFIYPIVFAGLCFTCSLAFERRNIKGKSVIFATA